MSTSSYSRPGGFPAGTTVLGYHPDGRLATITRGTVPEATISTYTHDAAGRTASISHVRGGVVRKTGTSTIHPFE
jgi:hypothetical protein